MKKIFLISVFVIMYFNNYGSILSGVVYLENQIDHSGIEILCKAVSLTAHTDSVYTVSNGTFAINLSNGIYNISIKKQGFASFTVSNYFLICDSVLTSATLLIEPFRNISGSLTGTLYSDTIYGIIGNINVNSGNVLIIEAGTKLKFKGFYKFTINGKIIAKGQKNNPIIFTSGSSSPAKGDWNNILFSSSCNLQSIFSNCIVEYGTNFQSDASILTINNNITIDSCIIRESNSHGIGILSGSPIIKDCQIYNNIQGGIQAQYGAPVIKNCRIHDNGWQGIRAYKDSTNIENNCIYNNSGGVIIFYKKPLLKHNLIFNNHSSGICVGYSGSADLYNNTIYNNFQEGVKLDGATNVVMSMNNITDNQTAGLNVVSLISTLTCKYNLFYGNQTSNIINPPLGVGTIFTTNVNGTACDSYYNIYENPLYASIDINDSLFLNLQSSSPCINAGDPLWLFDIDNSISDIGAIPFDNTTKINKVRINTQFETYPNPTNSICHIFYEVEERCHVTIEIINQIGICQKSVLNEVINSGNYDINIDIDDLESGLYFIKAFFNNRIILRKIIKL